MDRFETKRLVAERLSPEDYEDLRRIDRDPRIMDAIGGIRSEAETRAYLEKNLAHWDEHGHGLWMLRLRGQRTLVGRAALRRMEFGGEEELVLGYALVPDFWGRGFATEIGKAIVDLAFHRLGSVDLVAGTLPHNEASRRVMEKIGMVYERDVFYKNAPHVSYRLKR